MVEWTQEPKQTWLWKCSDEDYRIRKDHGTFSVYYRGDKIGWQPTLDQAKNLADFFMRAISLED
jgi:hypothetical protein